MFAPMDRAGRRVVAGAIQVVFFDIGGVVLSNGWDHAERARAAARFGLEAAELEARHAPRAAALELGELSLERYLAEVVFDRPRGFTAAEFAEYMFSLSEARPETLAVLEALAGAGRARLAALNNESRELNAHRIERFGLKRYFGAFCSSCYLAARKPGPEIFGRALGILQAAPEACLFVDDREENAAGAQAAGMDSVRFIGAAELRAQLLERGLL